MIDSFIVIFWEGLSFIYRAISYIFCDEDGKGDVYDNDNGDHDDDFYLDWV